MNHPELSNPAIFLLPVLLKTQTKSTNITLTAKAELRASYPSRIIWLHHAYRQLHSAYWGWCLFHALVEDTFELCQPHQD